MTATITSNSSSIIISGRYKQFLSGSGSNTTVIQFGSGEAPAGADAGRFLQWRNNTAQSGTWETRFIISATSSNVTVGDGGFSASPSSSETFVVSSKLSDIESATTACTVQGKQYSFNGRDWTLTNGAFLADVNISLDMTSGSAPGWPMANGTSAQFGRLLGGEANDSIETTQGCHLIFTSSRGSAGSLFTDNNARIANAPVINYYGCLVESSTTSASNWRFQRMNGPVRFIGCVFDGPMGGRFYHEASEWIDCRMSGNNNTIVAWSIGATFTRDISGIVFYDGLAAMKSYLAFGGTVKNTTFLSSLGVVFRAEGSSGSTFNFIDCTTFADSGITDANGGTINQFKSVNYVIADSSGVGLSDVKVAIYDSAGAIQGSIQTSASGALAEIITRFFIWVNSSPSTNRAPFDIRLRKFGLVYQGFQSAVSEPIKQEIRLRANTGLVSNEAQASAITGISINFATKTLTITVDTNTQELYDYYQYQLAQTGSMQYPESFVKAGIAFDLNDWDMDVNASTYAGDVTTTGIITLGSGGVFNGTRTDANGTISPPVTYSLQLPNILVGSRFQIYNETSGVELTNALAVSGGINNTYTKGTDYTAGDAGRYRVTYQNGVTAKELIEGAFTFSSGSAINSLPVSQVDDAVYIANAIDGSTLTSLFSADFVNNEIDILTATNFNGVQLYAYFVYVTTTAAGISGFAGGFTAVDQANYRVNVPILNAYLNNNTTTNIVQLDNVRIYRTDGAYPARNPTTGGGGIDVVWRDKIFIAETGVSGLTPAESANLAAIVLDTNELQSNQANFATADISGLETKTQADAGNTALLAEVALVKAKTDKLTFDAANRLSGNIKAVNDAAIAGTGTDENPFGPS